MLNKELSVQECDATMLNSNTHVGNKIFTLINKELLNLTMKAPI